MTLPSFTAEASLSKSDKFYKQDITFSSNFSIVLPQVISSPCDQCHYFAVTRKCSDHPEEQWCASVYAQYDPLCQQCCLQTKGPNYYYDLAFDECIHPGDVTDVQ
jgi:hypothetical protein